MEYYLVCLVAYLFLNDKADVSYYKITFIMIIFILSRWLLPEYLTVDVLRFLAITDSLAVLLLLILAKDRLTLIIISIAVIPKITDIILCNFSNGNVPLALLTMTLNADEYFIVGIITTLLFRESSSVITQLYVDPKKVGYRLFIMNSIFGVTLLLNF
jgi:hypothetical protein